MKETRDVCLDANVTTRCFLPLPWPSNNVGLKNLGTSRVDLTSVDHGDGKVANSLYSQHAGQWESSCLEENRFCRPVDPPK